MSLTGIRASGTRHAAASRRTSSNMPSQLVHGILQAKACVTSLIDAARLQTERVSNEAVIAAKASHTSSSRPNTLVAQIEAARLAAREQRGSKARAASGGEGEGQRVIVLWAADEDTIAGIARNTYANPGGVAQFDFHQSDNSNVSFPLLSFLSSSDLMESARAWYFMTSVFITSI
jgi:hypothetical protein